MGRIEVLVGERKPIFPEGLCGIINAAEGMEVVGAGSRTEAVYQGLKNSWISLEELSNAEED